MFNVDVPYAGEEVTNCFEDILQLMKCNKINDDCNL